MLLRNSSTAPRWSDGLVLDMILARRPVLIMAFSGPRLISVFAVLRNFGRRRIRSLFQLRDNVLPLDLLNLLTHGAIDFSDLRYLFTSNRPVRTGIGVPANDAQTGQAN
jgi:hypothetical protein